MAPNDETQDKFFQVRIIMTRGKNSKAPKAKSSSPKVEAELARRRRLVRNFPASVFEESLDFAKKIFEFGSGEPVRRLTLFDHIGKAPESGASRQIITNANKYGLIKGGYQSDIIELLADGQRAADPQMPARDQARARMKLAIEDIDIFNRLHERFVGKALPAKAALIDAASEFGAAKGAAEEAIDTFIINLRFVGLLKTLSGAERIVSKELALDQLPATSSSTSTPSQSVGKATAIITADHAHFESTCFYITPIGAAESEQRMHSDLFLGSFIEPSVSSFNLTVVRADAIDKPGIITKQVIEYIVKSRLVIADLSYQNPNVFYELAIRHMMRLPIVQIIRKADLVPFDINQMRTIIIDTTNIFTLVPRIATIQSDISSQIRRALENADATDTPVSTYFPGLVSRLS